MSLTLDKQRLEGQVRHQNKREDQRTKEKIRAEHGVKEHAASEELPPFTEVKGRGGTG